MSTISKKVAIKKGLKLLRETLKHSHWTSRFAVMTVKSLNILEKRVPGSKHLIRKAVDVMYENEKTT